MKIRNPFAIRARQRKAGAHAHVNAPRGGERQQARREIDLAVAGLTFVCPCGTETEACLPHRTTRVQHTIGVCDDCIDRLGLKSLAPATEE